MDTLLFTTLIHKKNNFNGSDMEKIFEIPINDIKPNSFQIRRNIDETEIMSLAKSISQLGIIQPLNIRKTENSYELVCGERRLKAAKIAGLKAVPCIISDISQLQSALIFITENLQRKDLNFFEQAKAIKMLIDVYNITQQEAALKLGISQPTIANKLRLLNLSENEQDFIIAHNLSERHARALLRIDSEHRKSVLKIICDKSLNADQTDKYINQLLKKDKIKQSYMKRSAAVGDVRLFFNTVEKALNIMRLAGVDAKAEKKQENGFIEYTIKIPQNKQKSQIN